MDQRKSFNFRRHTSPPASKKFLLRFLFYALLLGILSYLIYTQLHKKKPVDIDEVDQIDQLEIVLE